MCYTILPNEIALVSDWNRFWLYQKLNWSPYNFAGRPKDATSMGLRKFGKFCRVGAGNANRADFAVFAIDDFLYQTPSAIYKNYLILGQYDILKHQEYPEMAHRYTRHVAERGYSTVFEKEAFFVHWILTRHYFPNGLQVHDPHRNLHTNKLVLVNEVPPLTI